MGGQIGKFGRYFPIRESLASGEIAIQLAAYPDYTEPLKIKGAPIDWGTPTPMFFVGLTVQANKSAPHPNAARLVVDFILTPEAQKIIGGTGKIPADPANRPGGFARLNDAMMEPMDANRLWSIHSKDWFNERIRKYFAAGR